MKRRHFLIGLNLIAPGIGQIAGGFWLRGAMELLATIACFLWCVAEAIGPVVVSAMNLISGKDEIVQVDLWRVGASVALIILLYIFSIVELALIVKDEGE
jgi:hypothetical protein